MSAASREWMLEDDDADTLSMPATVKSPASYPPAPLSAATCSVMGNGNISPVQTSGPPRLATTPHNTTKHNNRSTEESHKPLTLLDLPLDILREIVKEITLTHDLTSLARTCSALHALAIPAMYSRFDIVWPEPTPVSDQQIGVDALSYGLATLVMGANAFREIPSASPSQSGRHYCHHCGCAGTGNQAQPQAVAQAPTLPLRTNLGKFRIGNSYAEWTKKFCIGNGPTEWVQEYAITRETGKLLGTLVALAVSRMTNLESFIWDMPTGVMRDVFLALASLDARPDCECRLEKVWVRWHDNSQKVAPFSTVNALSAMRRANPMYLYRGVEYPTFSVLPPMKSLSVLNIDEAAYLEEMAILIDRSRHKLVELRIGMASTSSVGKWAFPTELAPTPYSQPHGLAPDWPRPAGVLSILLSTPDSTKQSIPEGVSVEESWIESDISTSSSGVTLAGQHVGLDATTQMLGNLAVDDVQASETRPAEDSPRKTIRSPPSMQKPTRKEDGDQKEILKLEILELENVVIYAPVLIRAIDWSRLTKLTILHCEHHESLWRALRRKYTTPTESSLQDCGDAKSPAHYPFKLKHLHTDRVSPYLMLFLKEAIAPNTLESVYFQEGVLYNTVVPIEAIYKHVLRRQRSSLKRVLIDRSRAGETISLNHGHWRDWMLSREALAFVTSGRMPQLRELGIGMDRRDWHFFLQRLPNLTNLRALYLPNMFDPTLGRNKHKELALQVLDIVTLRPEIQLCYIGIEDKCFEILETPVSDKKGNSDVYRDSPWYSDSDSEAGDHVLGQASEPNSDDEDINDDDDDDDDDESEHTSSFTDEDYNTDEDIEDHDDSSGSRYVFRLREILFYDDKISVFKARHCSL